MSDSSDNDLLPNNVLSFQYDNMAVSARGPKINSTNFSFRNNVTSTTMQLPRNFERQRYLEPSYEQRSMYHRRDPSPPMSLHSGSDFRSRNHQQMYYPRGARSTINGRSGSPMSVRTIDSNASVSAADIAMAFKNINFNKYDLRIIKEAYNKFMKRRIRKKIEKRRNLRTFLKSSRRKSGYDSGELGSESSSSSDGCTSTRSAMYRYNMSSSRSTRTDLTDFRRSIKESNMYKDCTENIRQNSYRNTYSIAPGNISMQSQYRTQNNPSVSQKDRFKSGYLFPSQRFNQSVASIPIHEKQSLPDNHLPGPRIGTNKNNYVPKERMNETDSETEEIFSEMTHREERQKSICEARSQIIKTVEQRKRSLDNDDHRFHDNKRSKLSPNKNEFEFVKPQFPIRKSGITKGKEKLLAKSAPPLTDVVTPIVSGKVEQEQSTQVPTANQDEMQTSSSKIPDVSETSVTDVSMRPSFIKRKLYTQKLDVMESKNLSSDNLGANSPQTNIYSAIQKEKNKARKLVTNQSCLSRDVQQEDNNLLDLIHKIVPPDRMNITNVANKSEVVSNTCKNKTDSEKWDVTSVISKCNLDDVSDTYTDEEIFQSDGKKMKAKKISLPQEKTKALKNGAECKVLVEKMPLNKGTLSQKHQSHMEKKDTRKGIVNKCVTSFWDTDFESDFENNGTDNCKSDLKENRVPGFTRNASLNASKDNAIFNNSKLNISTKIKTTLSKTSNITNQVKKLNISLSLMKKPKRDEKRLDSPKLKETQDPKACPKSNTLNKVTASTKIVLDSHKSTLSDTNNETLEEKNNSKTRAARRTKDNANENLKTKNAGLNNSEIISDTKTESKLISNKKNETKPKTKKLNANNSITKRVSPRKTQRNVQESKESPLVKRTPKSKITEKNKEPTSVSNNLKSKPPTSAAKSNSKPQPKKGNSTSKRNTSNSNLDKSGLKTKPTLSTAKTTPKSQAKIVNSKAKTMVSNSGLDKSDLKADRSKLKNNTKTQPKKANNDNNSIAKRKSPRTPKEFKCCTDAIKSKDKCSKDTTLKPKNTLSQMQTFLDNNNSSCSDGTPIRALRSMKNREVIPSTRRRVAGY